MVILKVILIFVKEFSIDLTIYWDLFIVVKRIVSMRLPFIALIFSLIGFWLQPNVAKAQSQNLDDINLQVNFINESIHGIMVANKLFELFNQDINQFVDLDSYKLQGFNNSDLPTCLFDESSKDYYERLSPKAYFTTISGSKSIAQKNKVLAVQLNALNSDIDKKRFDIEKYLEHYDLTQRENLPGIYGLLENCVSLYKSYYKLYSEYASVLNADYDQMSASGFEGSNIYNVISDMHQNTVKTMDAIRNNETKIASTNLRNVGLMYVRLKKELANHRGKFLSLESNQNFYPKIESFIGNVRDYTEGVPVKENYVDYGMPYYYHNKRSIAKVNKYGNGFVHEFNLTVQNHAIPVMELLQVPHYFKVIYPKNIEITQQISSTQRYVAVIPDEILNRKVKDEEKLIKTNKKIFEVELFDHMVQDGDLLSVNFNGDWILENYSLEKKSKKLRLELNPNGKNFLILYAVSVGQRPPNTMAVKYINLQNEEVQIILKSDLKASEVIEIRYQKS